MSFENRTYRVKNTAKGPKIDNQVRAISQSECSFRNRSLNGCMKENCIAHQAFCK
jgi:hypothetical protein